MHLKSILIILFTLIQSPPGFAEKKAVFSIIIDDMGYNVNDFQALLLPKEISFSILPFTPQGKLIAKRANQQGRELLLHMPMQAKMFNEKLGKGALMSAMQENEFKATLRQALDYLPNAQGINNHMGSALTEEVEPMRWTMEVLKTQGLYFLDSRTSVQTVAENIAKKVGIPALRRHIFLDNIKTDEAMQQQLQLAIRLTRSNSSVVIIAHPYPQTLRFLQQELNKPTTQFKLIALSRLIPKNQRLAMAQKKSQFQQANHRISTKTFPQIQ